jgi:glycosyltransferase involved in cell wall biosynthesis
MTAISFCIPTYNRLDTFNHALTSVLSQQGLDTVGYEILVGDDSTNDETKDFLESNYPNDPKIRYLRNSPHGQFYNLNNLISSAKGEWLIFLHDDDILANNYLQRVSPYFESDYDFIWSGRKLIDVNYNVFNKNYENCPISPETVDVNTKNYLDEWLKNNNYNLAGTIVHPMVSGLTVKTELAKKTGFNTDFKVNSDGLFLWDIMLYGKQALFINKPLFEYMVIDDSERAKPSKNGTVYSEIKGITFVEFDHITKFNSELKKNIPSYTGTFYRNMLRLNSPISWLALRYEKGYINRLKLIKTIVTDVCKFNPKLLLIPVIIPLLLIAVLPKSINMLIYKSTRNTMI